MMKIHLHFITLFSLLIMGNYGYAQSMNDTKTTIFQCQLSDKSTIQIQHNIINKIDYYTYSRIKNGRKQIELTQNKTQMLQNSQQHYLEYRGNGVNMFFPNGIYGYNVFSAFELPRNETDNIIFHHGVIISKGANELQTINCEKTPIPLSNEHFM